MKKWFVAVGVVLAALVVLVVVGVSKIGPIIKQAVNSKGPEITGTDLHVGAVDIALLTGRASLEDFFLGNPKGFDSPYAVSVKAIKVDLNEKSLTKDTVIVDRIEVIAPHIIFEKSRKGDNFKALLRNMQRSVGSGTESQGQSSAQSGKKLVVKEFILRDGKVNLSIQGLKGKELSATLPEIRLQNIGQQQGGVTPAQAAKEIFAALYGQMTSTDMTAALKSSLPNLSVEVPDVGAEVAGELDAAKKQTTQGIEDAKKSFKDLLGK